MFIWRDGREARGNDIEKGSREMIEKERKKRKRERQRELRRQFEAEEEEDHNLPLLVQFPVTKT